MDTLKEWITPREASLEVSIRRGYFVSPDALRQLKRNKKIPESQIKHLTRQVSLYNRTYILDHLPAPKKSEESKPITKEQVATWLEDYPETVEHLREIGFAIPDYEEASKIVEERRKAKINR